jgi:hypothetical protein
MHPPQDHAHPATSRGFSALLKEPLLHFLLLAAALFLVQALWGKDERELIVVDPETRNYLIAQRQELLSRPMSDEDKQRALDAYIEEELLVREARKRGYDNTSRVRKLLAQNMRFFFFSDQQDPGEEQLRAFYEANPEKFERPATATYEHVVRKQRDAVAEGLLARLNAGEDHRDLGEFSTFDRPVLRGLSESEVAAMFGGVNAVQIVAIDDRNWHGPFTTARGVHFVRVSERLPGTKASFEEVEGWISREWSFVENRKVMNRELEKIRAGYRIEVAGSEATSEAAR